MSLRRADHASIHVVAQDLPDLLDRIEVVRVAADLVGAAGAVDLRLDDARHAGPGGATA